MKRTLRALGVIAALSAGSASTARADILVNQQFCGGNNFTTCAFISSSTTTVGGNTVLKLEVTNPVGNNAGSVFTEIGIANLPDGYSLVEMPTSSDPNFVYSSTPNGLSGAGIEKDVIGFEAVPPPSKTGLMPGETVTFYFTFSGTVDLTGLQYAIHDQGGAPAGCAGSTKLVVTGSVSGGYAPNVASCGPPPTTVIPEPASMALLASGLLSLGGAGAARRRRRDTAA